VTEEKETSTGSACFTCLEDTILVFLRIERKLELFIGQTISLSQFIEFGNIMPLDLNLLRNYKVFITRLDSVL
jgi:hypothetical protein